MKWTVGLLILLGVVAAASASVLVASLTSGQRPIMPVANQAPKEVDVLVANKAMAAMTVVQAESVRVEKIALDKAPVGYVSHPVNAVGKLLAVSVIDGQALTEDCFATDASGAHLASTLTDGMRAVSVSLKPEKVGLLYPGSIVDVLVSLTIPSADGNQRGEAVVMTLLQGISVLAIDDRTVLSGGKQSSEIEHVGRPQDHMVTLKVDSNQAKALQLATRFGTVSLALRNPLDAYSVEQDTTLLSELKNEYSGLLARLAGRDADVAEHPDGVATEQRTASASEAPYRCEICQRPTWSTFGVCTREGKCREELQRRMAGIFGHWRVEVHRGSSVEVISGVRRRPQPQANGQAEVTAIAGNASVEGQ